MARIDKYGYVILDSNDPYNRKSNGKGWIWLLIIAVVLVIIAFKQKHFQVTTIQDESYFSNIDYYGWSKSDAVQSVQEAGWKASCIDVYWGHPLADHVCYFETDSDNHTVDLYINQGISDEVIEETGAWLSCSEEYVELEVGDSKDLVITAEGNLPDSFYFEVWWFPEIETFWGDWIDFYSATITITGTEKSEGYARFYIHDAETEQILGYHDIYIDVY